MEILVISVIFSLKTAFPWNLKFRGDQEILENMYLMYINARRTPARNPRRSKVFFRRFHEGFRGWTGEFVCNFCKLGTILVATEFLLANTLLFQQLLHGVCGGVFVFDIESFFSVFPRKKENITPELPPPSKYSKEKTYRVSPHRP